MSELNSSVDLACKKAQGWNANRRMRRNLIAAAPALLEACKAFLREAESWHEMHHDNPTTQCDSICECIPAAKRAIAAAEGRDA